MAQPLPYNRDHNFVLDEEGTVNSSALNAEFDNASLAINTIRENLAKLQNDDGTLRSGVVNIESLDDSVVEDLVKEAKKAADSAMVYVAQAQTAANSALQSKTSAENSVKNAKAVLEGFEKAVENEADYQVALVEKTGNEQEARVIAEGNTQESRVRALGDLVISGYGVLCQEVTWDVSSAVASGTTINLPAGFGYMVGRNHLRVEYNGITLYKPDNFEEVGDVDTESSQIKINMPLAVGDELMAWTVPLGRGATDEVLADVEELRTALADLSSKVVYKE